MAYDMESDNLEQLALLWEFAGYNSFGVVTVSETPVEINARYITSDIESSGAQQSPHSKTPDVIVDRDIAIGSIIWLGGFEDIPGTGTSLVPDGSFYQVTKFTKTPDLKARNFHRGVFLMSFGNTLPETV